MVTSALVTFATKRRKEVLHTLTAGTNHRGGFIYAHAWTIHVPDARCADGGFSAAACAGADRCTGVDSRGSSDRPNQDTHPGYRWRARPDARHMESLPAEPPVGRGLSPVHPGA